MTRICRVLAAALVAAACLAPGVAAADDFAAWSHAAPVEVSGDGKYKAIFLTPEVYRHAAAGLADLRLADSSGKPVPYYIQRGDLTRQQNETVLACRLIDSYQAGDDSYYEFGVTVADNTDPVGNRLVFTLPAGVFVQQIEIYGSHDGVKWQYLAKDYVYRVEGREKQEASLGEARKFRHYRIRVLNDAAGPALKEMSLVSRKEVSNWTRYEQTTRLEYEIASKDRQTVITLKNPDRLRLKRLVFDIDGNFRRTYGVYVDAKANRPLQSGEIYSLRYAGVDVAGKDILFKAMTAGDIAVVKIEDRDDRPLAIKGIEAEYYVDKLVFPDLGDKPYRLYFGNAGAEAPRYELGLQRAYIEKEPQDECRLLAAEANRASGKGGLPVRSDYLFNAAIVAVSLLLIVVLVPKLSNRR